MKVAIFNADGDLLDEYSWNYELPKPGDTIYSHKLNRLLFIVDRHFNLKEARVALITADTVEEE